MNKKKYFINCTNHPYEKWAVQQKEEAKQWGEVIDLPFPQVASDGTLEEIKELAENIVEKILEFQPCTVLCQGEFTLTYQIVSLLKLHNIESVAACSDRVTYEETAADGTMKKVSCFKFVQFRRYS